MAMDPKQTALRLGREIGAVISAHTLKVARPLFWHPGAHQGGVAAGATAFVLQFENRLVAVTADHVIAAYLEALDADSTMLCQLGNAQVWPQKSLIARSSALDIATFHVEVDQLRAIGGDTLDCRGRWPPPEVSTGDILTLTGYLDNHRTRTAIDRYDMEAWGGHGVADAVSDREIVTTYDPDRELGFQGIAKPSLGMNLSGCSGGPVVMTRNIRGILRWFPVGLIYKGPGGQAEGELGQFDRIHVRRINRVRSNGTIDEPSSGWLPS